MLHLIKLAVGCASVDDLAEWQARRAKTHPPLRHRTRATPKRAEEILAGGSLYWVIAGFVQVRQRIVAIMPDTLEDGSPGCALHLDPALVPVQLRPAKPFQGWRYLAAADAPPDRPRGMAEAQEGFAAMPAAMRRELAELGLL
ncbi:DUF1489 family protein [Elioraea sp.]|jgi:hypothetical protein|uniref:DUF1489 family protein n=1 Tax=Elioraea sp. TaxID=2185103 RepID=UPI0021DCB6C2|nr:DUF1489 domain-containing protein [Elioraea sp.]GIX10158.1 MAG: lysophospholipase [Elioraea sp.]